MVWFLYASCSITAVDCPGTAKPDFREKLGVNKSGAHGNAAHYRQLLTCDQTTPYTLNFLTTERTHPLLITVFFSASFASRDLPSETVVRAVEHIDQLFCGVMIRALLWCNSISSSVV